MYRISYRAGLIGSPSILLGSVITALLYTGSKGEAYSPLNHWVSELGQVSVSRAAMIFNISLLIGGVCFAIFMSGVASRLQDWYSRMFRVVGVVAGFVGILVGVFSMDNLAPHALSACSLFIAVLLLVGSFSVYVLRTHPTLFPIWLVIPGAVTVVGIIGCMSSVDSFSIEALAARRIVSPSGTSPFMSGLRSAACWPGYSWSRFVSVWRSRMPVHPLHDIKRRSTERLCRFKPLLFRAGCGECLDCLPPHLAELGEVSPFVLQTIQKCCGRV